MRRISEVVAVDAQHQRAVRAADHVVFTIDDRLADTDGDARQLLQARVELAQELRLGFVVGPAAVRRQADPRFDVRGRPWIGAGIVAAELGHDVRHLGELAHRAAQLAGHLAGLVQRQAGGHLHLQPQRALVQVGQKLAARVAPSISTRRQRHAGDA
jgi:hypothetical protein